MTAVELQALMTTIDGHIDGKTGSIDSVSLKRGKAQIVLDYATFAEVFTGQDVDQLGALLSKDIGAITYMAEAPVSPTFSVP